MALYRIETGVLPERFEAEERQDRVRPQAQEGHGEAAVEFERACRRSRVTSFTHKLPTSELEELTFVFENERGAVQRVAVLSGLVLHDADLDDAVDSVSADAQRANV